MSIEYLDLADYIAIATAVTGLDLQTVMNMTNHDLADSALHAPTAGIGDTDFYPDFVDKASVLVVRLARNHPLPDGNKRAAWVSLRLFVDINGWTWDPKPDMTRPKRRWSRSLQANGTKLPQPPGYSSIFGRPEPATEFEPPDPKPRVLGERSAEAGGIQEEVCNRGVCNAAGGASMSGPGRNLRDRG